MSEFGPQVDDAFAQQQEAMIDYKNAAEAVKADYRKPSGATRENAKDLPTDDEIAAHRARSVKLAEAQEALRVADENLRKISIDHSAEEVQDQN